MLPKKTGYLEKEQKRKEKFRTQWVSSNDRGRLRKKKRPTGIKTALLVNVRVVKPVHEKLATGGKNSQRKKKKNMFGKGRRMGKKTAALLQKKQKGEKTQKDPETMGQPRNEKGGKGMEKGPGRRHNGTLHRPSTNGSRLKKKERHQKINRESKPGTRGVKEAWAGANGDGQGKGGLQGSGKGNHTNHQSANTTKGGGGGKNGNSLKKSPAAKPEKPNRLQSVRKKKSRPPHHDEPIKKPGGKVPKSSRGGRSKTPKRGGREVPEKSGQKRSGGAIRAPSGALGGREEVLGEKKKKKNRPGGGTRETQENRVG